MLDFVVWESEYPDEGGMLISAWTIKGAFRKYRQAVAERFAGPDDAIRLDAVEATPEQSAAWREER